MSHPLKPAVVIATLGTGLCLTGPAFADLVSDSKASLELRNFYFNRDFRQDNASQSKQDEWAQGFLLRFESGYTAGTIGVGMDAIGLLGIKLDSSPDRAGSGLLPRGRSAPREAADDYSELGLTAKLKAANSVLKVGTLIPKLPTALANDSRLLPQTFQGAHLNSTDFAGLTLDAGRLTQVSLRDSSNSEDMTVTSGNARGIVATGTSDEFNFAGASYKWNDQLTTGYNYAKLDGLYDQHIVNLTHVLPITTGQSFKSDLRYARSDDDGRSNVDNRAFGALFTYSLGGHAFGLGYQKMSGDTGFAYIGGTDAFLVNFVQIGDFANADERSWQARYDYNFAALGIPGLTFMTRYLTGDDITLASGAEGKEWERNTDIAYVIQDGPLRNLGVKWRNATVRSTNFGNDLDENRLIVSYSLPLW